MTPSQFAEAKRLHDAGLKLCELHPMSKRPLGDGWNNKVTAEVRESAGGYGLLLAKNGMCSVDVDDEPLAIEGMARCGFSIEEIRDLGVWTSSTRPGSGGRVAFKVPDGGMLRWLKFSSKKHGTILELRAESQNLQDCLPGTTYRSPDGSGPWVQDYAGMWTLDCAPDLPANLLAWWQRMSADVDYLREQQRLLVGEDAQLSVSAGDGKLAYTSTHRIEFNANNQVVDILDRHGYTLHRNGRYAPSTATGAAAVRAIPGRDDLWQSDHASDPLHGTFDAWTAHVVLDHNDDFEEAERQASTSRALVASSGFEEMEVPVTVRRIEGSEREVEPEATPDAAIPWPNFERDHKTGKCKPIVNNIIAALRRPDISNKQIAFDNFRAEIMLAKPGTKEWRAFKDSDYLWLRARLEQGDNGFMPLSKELMRDSVNAIAEENEFDSAIDWLGGLKHDGVPRCSTFLIDYFQVEDTPYHRAVSAYLWTAMAARIMYPGCQADMSVILVGGQGARKTSAVKAMVPDNDLFVSIDLGKDEDDLARKMRGKLIGEIAELRGLMTKDLEAIKDWLTRTHEEWTPKFKEFVTKFARRLVFIGTTNQPQFLADSSGARRFLPVTVGDQIDVDGITAVREQCWAEAAQLVIAGGIQWRAAETLAKNEHDNYRVIDDWEPLVKAFLDDDLFGDGERKEVVTTTEVLVAALRFDEKHITRRESQRAADVLKALGYSRKKVRVDGVTKWAFVTHSTPLLK